MNKRVKEAVSIAVQAKVPTLIWGPPGTGKTAFIGQLAKKLDWQMEVVVASHHDPTEFNGLPVVLGDRVVRVAPDWAKRLKEKEGLVFFDELSTAPPATQAALLRFITERVIGDVKLGDTAIIAAANPPELAAGGWDLEPPTANRFIHLDWEADPKGFVEGVTAGWDQDPIIPLPRGWEENIPWALAQVGAFINVKPDALLDTKLLGDPERRGRAWPSPRSWEMAARLMAACKAAKAPMEVEALLVTAAVGPVGMEFLSWRKLQDLPDPEELLRNPLGFRRPARPDILYTVLLGIVGAVARTPSEERYEAAWEIVAMAAEGGLDPVIGAASRLLELGKSKGYKNPKGHAGPGP